MKRVVLDAKEEVSVASCKSENIYSIVYCGKIFKLSPCGNVYGFVAIGESDNWFSGMTADTIGEAIISQLKAGRQVYEFDNQTEFLKWALENSK